ncbi:MAG: hypothetical protein LH477_09765 [Nocardioides sp.]|nr:hypothetical protein [Nocardioides sp.]
MRIAGVLALVLLLGACSGEGSDISDLGFPDAEVPASLSAGCPPRGATLRLPGGDLPTGAVGVRLCPGRPQLNYDGNVSEPGIQAPLDELVTDVDRVVDVVNALPDQPDQVDCPFDGGPDLVFWFRYADGDARAVSYGSKGCHSLVVGGDRNRERGQDVATAFAEALRAQRDASTPPAASPEPAACDHAYSEPVSALPPVPIDLASARWCVGAKKGIRSAAIPESLLRRINDSPLTPVPSIREGCVPSNFGSTIQGLTAWGDRVVMLMEGCDRVQARSGFGREHNDDVHRFGDAGVQAALEALRLGPLETYDDG